MNVTTLRKFVPGIWAAEGPVVSFLGFSYPTRMALIRLSNGGLFIWSPIGVTDALKHEVNALL